MLRDAAVTDAQFILALRTDAQKSRYLSPTSTQLESQIEWLNAYADAKDQAYFIIEDLQAGPIGTVRLYDPKGHSFSWGSWIIKDGAPYTAAVESALFICEYGIYHLGFTALHFDVRKENENVWRFHERFGAKRVAETERDYFYSIGYEEIMTARKRYRKFLPNPIVVEWK